MLTLPEPSGEAARRFAEFQVLSAGSKALSAFRRVRSLQSVQVRVFGNGPGDRSNCPRP